MKNILRLIGVLLFIAILAGGVGWFIVFGSLASVADATPVPGVRIIKDGLVDIGIVDVGAGKVALIDAGNDETGSAVLAELAKRSLTAESVAAIFLTHGHHDHIAGCHLFPKAEIYALEADVALVEGRVGSHGPLTQYMTAKPTGVRVTHPVHDGDVVSVGDKKFRVLSVPGHTPGSAAYLVANCLFVGDSANVTTWGEVVGAPWPLTDDSAQNHSSLKALANTLRAERGSILALVPSHSSVGTFDALEAFGR